MSRESSNVHDCFQLREMRSRLHSRRGRIERDPSDAGLAAVELSRGAAAPPRRRIAARGGARALHGQPGVSWETSGHARSEARGAGPYARRR